MNASVLVGDCVLLSRRLPERHFHVVVTSPPYFRQKDYGTPPVSWPELHYCPLPHVGPVVKVPAWRGELGQEDLPEQYVGHIVHALDSVARTLRLDGTLWLNLGDKSLKGELLGVPWLAALALQARGWKLLQEVVWAKRNPMPDSARGRPPRAHEQVFLFAPPGSTGHYFDPYGERLPDCGHGGPGLAGRQGGARATLSPGGKGSREPWAPGGGVSPRSVWTLTSEPLRGGQHFAAFPSALPERCLRLSTPEGGCCATCGAALRRLVRKMKEPDRPGRRQDREGDSLEQSHGPDGRSGGRYRLRVETLGWERTCTCRPVATVPARVLDPFGGTGRTAIAAERLGLDCTLIEASPAHAHLAQRKIEEARR